MGKNNRIGILFACRSDGGIAHDFFAPVLESFKNTCEKKGYDISFINCNLNRANYLTYMEQVEKEGYDGVFVACIEYDDEEGIELWSSDIPTVSLDEELPNTFCVKSDNVNGMKQLVEYIISMGHTKIAYIMGDNNSISNLRLKIFRETCEAHGVKVSPNYIKCSKYRDISKAGFYTEELLRLADPPTCIMYSDDYASIGGFNALRARGLHVPKDMSVSGYDGLTILANYEPRIATVKQNTSELGRLCAVKLIEIIEHPDSYGKEPIIVDTILEKGRTIREIF